ncbi:50S ribosomal protein L25/general stress protein Ctc [Mycobacterium sp. NPDC050853]|uniref:50S ribosomal protein L25/general stress protein Ctc n=1 Tax=Mycobacteriaceae TaxID=1762 RepID=UPI0015DF7E27|nr:50S ribosomal protein L25/general stress protein Ctc [Mycobacteroides sp. LB1]
MSKKNAPSGNNLDVTVRQDTGKGASRRARRDGLVPAVLYGHNTTPEHLNLPARDFSAVLRNSGTNAVLTLNIEGREQLALTKTIEIHPIRRNLVHADLLVVRKGEKVTVEVNVHIEGDAASGTLVAQDANTLEIEAEALSIPDHLTVSVEGLEAGTQITAGSIELPAGSTLISDPDTLVINVVAAPTSDEMDAEGGGNEGAGEASAAGDAAEASTEE